MILIGKILDIGPLGRIGKDGLGLDGGALASAACLLVAAHSTGGTAQPDSGQSIAMFF